jgi:hypothetical protein
VEAPKQQVVFRRGLVPIDSLEVALSPGHISPFYVFPP